MPFSKILLREVFSKNETLDALIDSNLGNDVFNEGPQPAVAAKTSVESQEEIYKKQPGILDDYPM